MTTAVMNDTDPLPRKWWAPYFTYDLYDVQILFESWRISSLTTLVMAHAFIFALVFLEAYFSYRREKKEVEKAEISGNGRMPEASPNCFIDSWVTLYSTLEKLIHYLIMLLVMSFNVWILLNVCLSYFVVKLFFAYKIRRLRHLQPKYWAMADIVT